MQPMKQLIFPSFALHRLQGYVSATTQAWSWLQHTAVCWSPIYWPPALHFYLQTWTSCGGGEQVAQRWIRQGSTVDGLEQRFVHSQWLYWQSLMEPSFKMKPEFEPVYKRQGRQSLSQPFFIIPQFKVVSSISDVSNSGFRAASKGSSSAQSIWRWGCLRRPYILPWKTVSIEAQIKFINTVPVKGA